MGENEFDEMRRKWKESLQQEAKQRLQESAEVIHKFIDYAALYGILLQEGNFSYVPTIGIVLKYPGIVKTLHPELITDKDHLVKFSLLNEMFSKHPLGRGYLYAGNHMLMAHPFYRREYYENANFAPRIIDYLWDFNQDSVELSVALDWNRLRINVNELFYMEFDTWYGAKFNKEISKIPDGISKLVPPPELEEVDVELFFGNVKALNIKWASSKTTRTFVAEEFKCEKEVFVVDGEKYHPVRYIHSEYDLQKRCFIHLDGAIHLYTTEEYGLMEYGDMNYNQKSRVNIKSRSVKLFKMNGEIDIETWQLYVSQFFRKNPLIFEYFEGQYPEYVSETLKKLIGR